MGVENQPPVHRPSYETIGYHMPDFINAVVGLMIDNQSIETKVKEGVRVATDQEYSKLSLKIISLWSDLKFSRISKNEFYRQLGIREVDLIQKAKQLNIKTASQVNNDQAASV